MLAVLDPSFWDIIINKIRVGCNMGVIPINFSVEAEVFLRKKGNMSRFVNALVLGSISKSESERKYAGHCDECGNMRGHRSSCRHWQSSFLSNGGSNDEE